MCGVERGALGEIERVEFPVTTYVQISMITIHDFMALDGATCKN